MRVRHGMLKLMLEVTRNDGSMWCPSEAVEEMLGELPFVEQVWDGGAQAPAVIVELDSPEEITTRLPEYEAVIMAIIEKRAMPREFRAGRSWELIFGYSDAGQKRYVAARKLAIGF